MIRTPADVVFSRWIRERDGYRCQRCGAGYPSNSDGLHCAHMFGRGKPATRIDPENACALCWLCHSFMDAHPTQKQEFFRARLGDEAFEALQRRSNGSAA